MLSKVRNVANTVESVLSNNEDARNSDIELIILVWERQGLTLTPTQIEQIKSVSTPESITRCRRKFQEEGKYKANKEVTTERKIRSYEMQQAIQTVKPKIHYDRETNTVRFL